MLTVVTYFVEVFIYFLNMTKLFWQKKMWGSELLMWGSKVSFANNGVRRSGMWGSWPPSPPTLVELFGKRVVGNRCLAPFLVFFQYWQIIFNNIIKKPSSLGLLALSPRNIVYSNGVGAISTEHSSSEMRVIGTNAHQVDSCFLLLTMHT